MTKYYLGLTAVPLLMSQGAMAGITSASPQLTAVPIDSPWVLSALAISLAVIGIRILKNRSK
jgi:hypothetical protein